jgi:hypothetical protein
VVHLQALFSAKRCQPRCRREQLGSVFIFLGLSITRRASSVRAPQPQISAAARSEQCGCSQRRYLSGAVRSVLRSSRGSFSAASLKSPFGFSAKNSRKLA